MCRNIKILFNFDPPATEEEIHAAALQYVRKISGVNKPTQRNEVAFDKAVASVAYASAELLQTMTTMGATRNREEEARKARQRSVVRFGK